jgi:cytochrome c oxidase subunit 4
MSQHIVSPKVYLAVFGALMLGTYLTVEASRHDFGAMNTVIAMVIAVTKAVLVVLYFMHVKYSRRLTQLVVAAAFVWLAVLLGVTLSDYYSPHIAGGSTPTISRE